MQQKVLVVEDNELNLKLFNDLLGAHGYKTIEVRDGRKAYEAIEREKPDLVIMDIQLPNVGGTEIIKRIKSNDNLRSVPILAVTAYAMKDDEEEIMEAGCEDYLSKPIDIKSFIDKVKKYTSGK